MNLKTIKDIPCGNGLPAYQLQIEKSFAGVKNAKEQSYQEADQIINDQFRDAACPDQRRRYGIRDQTNDSHKE